ncbi:phage portal protein [Undibacterium sp. Rencai35W]|uniref:phage portal protein n=1 Tax=Undibacterium sp. Rencai35W TaxID=3413046 RepID=UPI003BF17343
MFFSDIVFAGNGNVTQQGSGGWLGSALGGGWGIRADSGAVVTPQTALALTAVQRAVTILAEAVAQLPVNFYQTTPDDGRTLVRDHPAYALLRVAPNAFQTPFQFNEFKQLSLGLRGNAFALKFYDRGGRVNSLYPLNADRVQVMVSPVDRMPYYRILRMPDGIEGIFPLRDIHHVRWISDNAYTGISPVSLHRDAIGVALSTERHTGKMFGNGTHLSGVITRPATAPAIKDPAGIERITTEWAAKYAGTDNAGRVALLQEGMDFKPLSMSNEDAQLIAARQYGVRDIARIYGIPAHMLGDLDRATHSNIEQQSLEFVIYTLMPWLKRHEEAMERDFLSDEERLGGMIIQFSVAGLLRGDITSRYAAYAQARQWGWMSINDIRRMENLPPVAGGDIYLQPLNMTDARTPQPGIPPAGQPARATDKQIAAIEALLS